MAIDWDSWASKPSKDMDSEEAYADYARTAYELDGNDKAGEWLAERGFFEWLNNRDEDLKRL